MGFIDAMRGEGFAVETICRVLREQGVRVAARTYRAWSSPVRRVAARTVADAVVVDAIRSLRVDEDGRATPESLSPTRTPLAR
ncbi:hypothetical protein FHR89_002424 [Cellulomonas uda]|uniref:HTH-like domain-containing protein n=2 Tax=Cellulomonas uda TaxID=1714 RepID=A0A4Y3K8K4_CELUD|nr:hypothetical protein [Cellulomonas uda]GEA80801.1 hypothetical protein CUD01_12450 [Cellulomonas uda]